MASKHLNQEELLELLQSEIPVRRLVMRLLDHVLECCLECRGEYAIITTSSRPTGLDELRLPHEEPATLEGIQRLIDADVDFEALHNEGEREFVELMQTTAAARQMKIHRATKRYRNPLLVELLIEKSRKLIQSEPFEAYAVAECAHSVALRLPHTLFGSAWCMTSVARADAHRGNALRAVGNFKGAEPLLDFANALFHREGDGDPLVQGELLSLLASLRHDQRRFGEAAKLLEQCQQIYREIDDHIAEARVLIQQSLVFMEQGNPERAIDAAKGASGLLDPETDTHLFLCAEHNLAMALEDAGRYEDARDVLVAHTNLYQSFPDPWTQLRQAWSLGTTARGLGQLEEAESTLTAVRDGFIRQGLGFHAAQAGLDLALVYVIRGKTAELGKLAEQILPIFMSQDIHREAVTALMLFQDAVRQQAVTEDMVRELILYMKRVRRPANRQN